MVLGVLSFVAILLYFFLSPEKYAPLFPKCLVREGLGIHCTGCGSQRALHDLFNFRIAEGISHNLLLVPSLVLVGLHLVIRNFYPQLKSPLERKRAPIIILIIFLLFTVLRNLKGWPFEYLAP